MAADFGQSSCIPMASCGNNNLTMYAGCTVDIPGIKNLVFLIIGTVVLRFYFQYDP